MDMFPMPLDAQCQDGFDLKVSLLISSPVTTTDNES